MKALPTAPSIPTVPTARRFAPAPGSTLSTRTRTGLARGISRPVPRPQRRSPDGSQCLESDPGQLRPGARRLVGCASSRGALALLGACDRRMGLDVAPADDLATGRP